MDPVLPKLARDVLTAQQKDPSLTPADLDAYVRESSGGKYTLQHVQKLIASIDPSIGLRNLGRSAFQGLTMNFGDELAGLFGGENAKEEMRLRDEMFKKEHPVADAAAGIAGAVVPTLIAPEAEAATVGRAMLKGAATGAVVGGLSGAGAGEGAKDRIGKGIIGGVAGGVIGSTIPAVTGAYKYLRNPELRAAARIQHAIERSGGPAAVKKFADEAATAGRGADVMLADASPHLRQSADFAANASDDVLVPMAQKIAQRQKNQSQRLLDDVAAGPLGAADAGERQVALEADRKAWAQGPTGYGGIPNDASFDLAPLQQALTKPTVQSSWKMARLAGDLTDKSPLDQLLQKILASNPGADPAMLRQAAESGMLGKDVADMAQKAAGRPVTFDDLQQLRRVLQDKADGAYAKGNGALGEAYKTIKAEVDGALEKGVPGFKDINAENFRRMNLERALKKGSEAWNVDDSRLLARDVAKLTPEELYEYRLGMASQMITKLRSAATNRDEAKRLVDMSKAMHDKLQIVFGDQQTFDEFMRRVGVESELAKLRGVVGGSATARRLQNAGFDPAELGGEAATHLAIGGVSGTLHGLKTAVARATNKAVTRNTAREMGPMLMTQGSDAIKHLIDSWTQREPLLGAMATRVAPAAATRGALSLFNY